MLFYKGIRTGSQRGSYLRGILIKWLDMISGIKDLLFTRLYVLSYFHSGLLEFFVLIGLLEVVTGHIDSIHNMRL